MGYETFYQRGQIKLLILFFIIFILIVIFMNAIFNTIDSGRKLPPSTSTIHNRALRGSIISNDEYSIAKSDKTYTAAIYTQSLKKGKKSLFIKLFSIYSNISVDEIKSKFVDKNGKPKRGRVVLSKSIDASTAIYLKQLNSKLRKLKVFKRVKTSRGVEILYGLSIAENGEKRKYPLGDTLTPAIGYIKNVQIDGYSRVVGVKGLEKRYEKYLSNKKDGIVKGLRDVSGMIIRNGSSVREFRKDGYSLHLSINMGLQKRVEYILDTMQTSVEAKEIVAIVMESKSGRVLAIASSQRYNPEHITKDDIPKLNPKFTEYAYEPGSVIKPITLAIAIELGKVTPNSWFNTHNGRMRISRRFGISDDDPFASLNATDIIVHSSNIGITQIGWMLTGKQLYDGLKKFGLAQKSGIDLSMESIGSIRSAKMLENRVNRATQSYGYGMQATLIQLVKAHNVFNNDGIIVTPHLVDYLESDDGKRYVLDDINSSYRVISKDTAYKLHNILKQVIQRGTGKAAKIPGLIVGGKTGTAHIAVHGHYVRRYHSSFIGFANDKSGHKYEIGVLVIEAQKYRKYFAAQSAVPTFKMIVNSLVDLGYLEPSLTKKQKEQLEQQTKIKQSVVKKKRTQRTRRIKAILKKQREQIRKKVKKRYKQRKIKKRYKKRSKYVPKTKAYIKKKNPLKSLESKSKSKPIRPKVVPPPNMPDLF